MTVTTFLSTLGDLAVGMGAWLPLTFFCSVWETGHGPSRRMWVAPHVQASPLLVLTLSPLLGFILSCVFNHLQPSFLPVEALARREPQEHAKAREMVMVELRSHRPDKWARQRTCVGLGQFGPHSMS